MIPKPYSHAWLMSLALLLMVVTSVLAEPQLPDFTELIGACAWPCASGSPPLEPVLDRRRIDRPMSAYLANAGHDQPLHDKQQEGQVTEAMTQAVEEHTGRPVRGRRPIVRRDLAESPGALAR